MTERVNFDWPNAARMYDHLLGGAANFAVDRDAADELEQRMPDMRFSVRCNRALLVRAVRYLTREVGIDQFLDLGSGVPTVGNVHEIAHQHNPGARIAYVDIEPIACNHARKLLGDDEHRVSITQADLRQPETVLAAPGVAGLLDFTRPIALLTVGILHYVLDDTEVQTVMTAYRQALPAGSYCVVSHISPTNVSDSNMDQALRVMARTDTPARQRSPQQIRSLLPGWSLLDPPGLVPTVQWRPDTAPSDDDVHRCNNYTALGYLPTA